MSFRDLFVSSTHAMFQTKRPVMSRILPDQGTAEIWAHYPPDDVVNGRHSCRYFYHAHPPDEREDDEHGHFHLFIGKDALADVIEPLRSPPPLGEGEKRADVVHLAALAMSYEGLPLRWFAVNRWVTDEWLYPADTLIPHLHEFDVRGDDGDPLVNDWLTSIFQLSIDDIGPLLAERDQVLGCKDLTGEDRNLEIVATRDIDLERLFG